MLNIYLRVSRLIILPFCCLLLQRCNVVNPKEQTPTYIHIDSFKFDNKLSDVYYSNQVTCISVYYNNHTIGFFDLPATIPIIASGKGQLEVWPGIAVNGLNNLNSAYPFYTIDTSNFIAQPGKIINYTPHTGYFKEVKIPWSADFAGATGFARKAGNREITTVTADSLVFAGGGTGSILLTSPGDSSIDSSTVAFAIPHTNTAYIEFYYKSSVPFYVGLQAKLTNDIMMQEYFLAGIKPSDQWKKFYLNVADYNGQYQATSYIFYIKTVLPDGQPYGRLLIDNIQLVTF
jgi:hypothetical protein